MTVKELREWLSTLGEDEEVVVTEDATGLCVVGGPEWIEVGWDGDRTGTEAQP